VTPIPTNIASQTSDSPLTCPSSLPWPVDAVDGCSSTPPHCSKHCSSKPGVHRVLEGREPETPRPQRKSPPTTSQIQKVLPFSTLILTGLVLCVPYRKMPESSHSSIKAIAMNSLVSSSWPAPMCITPSAPTPSLRSCKLTYV
jgi:hypothetical protein